jgi:hypothetical protein
MSAADNRFETAPNHSQSDSNRNNLTVTDCGNEDCQLRAEGELADYLTVNIKMQSDSTFRLSWTLAMQQLEC